MAVTRPRVSLLMANYNGAAFIAASLRSALAQTMADLEIVVCDDASTDDSLAIARGLAAEDDRVRVVASDRNAGISATRNRAIDLARGQWLAVQDSDDLFHPERLARLLAAAERQQADLIADDLLEFPNDGDGPCKLLVGASRTFAVDARTLVRRSHVLGYLKPLWRAGAMRALRYNTDMVVAEDFDFALRMVTGGARYVFHPEALYFYRKHTRSISSGSDRRKQQSILAGDDRLRAEVPMDTALRRTADGRRRKILRHMAYDDAIEALRGRNWGDAFRSLARRPSSLVVFRINLAARLDRARRGVVARVTPASSSGAAFALFLAPLGATAALERPPVTALARLAATCGLALALARPGGRARGATWRTRREATAPFGRPIRLPRRTPAAADALPSAEALALATHASKASLVVATDPSLASRLAYRIDTRIPALVAGRDHLPADPASFRALLHGASDGG